MESKFRYTYDKRAKWLSSIETGILAGALAAIIFFAGEGYLQAWLLSLLGAFTALYILSIPRYIKVDANNFEIHCVVEMTRIDIRDIASIKKIGRSEFKRTFVLLGSYGFFGYYGYYLDFRSWEIIKVYATERTHLVEITDIYEQKYIVSCTKADQLIQTVNEARQIQGCETV